MTQPPVNQSRTGGGAATLSRPCCDPYILNRLIWPRAPSALNESLVLAAVIADIAALPDHFSSWRIVRAAPITLPSIFRSLAACAVLMISGAPAVAAVACGTGTFETWLADFKNDAIAKGVSQSAVNTSLNGVTQDKAVLSRDHSQAVFSQTFEQFSGRMVPPRLTRGSNMMKQYGSVLGRIEETYGVQGEVLVAIWGLETDFGVNIGKFPTIRSLATLAYDCRRSDLFRAELLDALRIVDRGDLTAAQMHGAWAGEIGQTQFMPSNYIKYAVDFDGNGHRDLLHSAPDVLASTANYLTSHGWQRGKGWEPGNPNFAVIQQWNKSEVYAKTIAYFATQLAHAP
jgi:membrane-bound lytic murein transglycosylase B